MFISSLVLELKYNGVNSFGTYTTPVIHVCSIKLKQQYIYIFFEGSVGEPPTYFFIILKVKQEQV
jgi:hypothetical protein